MFAFLVLSVIATAFCIINPPLRRHALQAFVATLAFGFSSYVMVTTLEGPISRSRIYDNPSLLVRMAIAMIVYFLPASFFTGLILFLVWGRGKFKL
jgi:hypothetical protein